MNPEPVFELSPDFAERVLREADRVRRRRLGGGVLASLAVAVVLSLSRSPAPASHPGLKHGAALEAADFAWLEEAGAESGDPEAMVVPVESASSSRSEGNPLVVVAENL